jgi:hypothetical protein
VVGGPCDGLRIVVREQGGRYRHPDAFDLTGYVFDPERWEFRARLGEVPVTAGPPPGTQVTDA